MITLEFIGQVWLIFLLIGYIVCVYIDKRNNNER